MLSSKQNLDQLLYFDAQRKVMHNSSTILFRKICLIPLSLILLSASTLKSQELSFGLGFGGMNYQGELTSTVLGEIISVTNPAFCLSLHYPLNEHFEVNLAGVLGKIEGDDHLSSDPNRRLRNLSFTSKINEFSLSVDYNIFSFHGQYSGKFTPFLNAGVGFYFFDPKTFYFGQSIRLQPLGTEGQGMAAYPDRKKYKLNGLSLPFGGGGKVTLNDRMVLRFSINCHYTFNDYLDDVSTTSINYNELLEGNGPLAAALGNRTGEYLNTAPVDQPSGGKRGSPGNDDLYYSVFLSLQTSITGWNKNVRGCPRF